MNTTLKEILMNADNIKPKKTINFSKFFPKDNAFVNVDGGFRSVEDWWVDFTVQTGTKEAISFWTGDWKPEENVKQLRAMIEGAQKAIDFAETCMKMKPAKVPVTKKPAAKKK
jgi:hypothetical protein